MNKKFIKKLEDLREYLIKIGNYYYSITISFFSTIGFMSGMFSLMLWNIELNGNANNRLNIIIFIFGVLIGMGAILLVFRFLIFIIKLLVKKQ